MCFQFEHSIFLFINKNDIIHIHIYIYIFMVSERRSSTKRGRRRVRVTKTTNGPVVATTKKKHTHSTLVQTIKKKSSFAYYIFVLVCVRACEYEESDDLTIFDGNKRKINKDCEAFAVGIENRREKKKTKRQGTHH